MEKTAKEFFVACETGKGWEGTKAYVADETSWFEAQVTDAFPFPKLSEVKTIKEYTEWNVAVVEVLKEKEATLEVKACAFDAERQIAIYYAVGGGSDYVYTLHFNGEGKINAIRKIWNDGYAMEHPFWLLVDCWLFEPFLIEFPNYVFLMELLH